MRLSKSAHVQQPWRIHAIAPDFQLQDVWSYRTPGAGPDDFPVVLALLQNAGGFSKQPRPVKFLFAVRWKLGRLLGWDEPGTGLGTRVESVRDRLPDDLAETTVPDSGDSPFSPVYRLGNEDVRELANKTVHGIMHLGWAPAAGGDYELRMAVLVKTNGRLGRLYMALIAPFRHLVVYPLLTRQWERAWRNRPPTTKVHRP